MGHSLQSAVKLYLDALHDAGVPNGTRRQYRSILYRFSARLRDRQFATVDAVDVARALYGPGGMALGKSKMTASSYRSAIRSLFSYGHLMGWRKTPLVVPLPLVSGRAARSVSPPTRLTADQLVLLLDAAQGEMLRCMLAVGISTALRISDISKIRLGELNLITGELAVETKKTGFYDILPVTLDLEEELHRYLRWYTRTTGRTLADREAYLFHAWSPVGRSDNNGFDRTPDVTRHVGYDWTHKRIRELFDQCGIRVEKGEAWHVIRRSVARIYFDMLRHSISYDHALRQTAALLGHKSVATTEKYLGLSTEIAARNESLRGKRFIGAATPDNVVPMQQRRHE